MLGVPAAIGNEGEDRRQGGQENRSPEGFVDRCERILAVACIGPKPAGEQSHLWPPASTTPRESVRAAFCREDAEDAGEVVGDAEVGPFR